MLIVLYGCGKGKTTSGWGTLMRASGRGKRCLAVEFFKPIVSGEFLSADSLSVDVIKPKIGFNPAERIPHSAAKEAEAMFSAIDFSKYDFILLDEILHTNVKNCDIIYMSQRVECLIATGRYADSKLIEAASIATEFVEIKHDNEFRVGIEI